MSIYSKAREPKCDSQFCYSTSLCTVCFLISEMEMIILVLIFCESFEDELNFNVHKILSTVLATLTEKVSWLRDWEFKDVHRVFMEEANKWPSNFSILCYVKIEWLCLSNGCCGTQVELVTVLGDSFLEYNIKKVFCRKREKVPPKSPGNQSRWSQRLGHTKLQLFGLPFLPDLPLNLGTVRHRVETWLQPFEVPVLLSFIWSVTESAESDRIGIIGIANDCSLVQFSVLLYKVLTSVRRMLWRKSSTFMSRTFSSILSVLMS